MLSWKYQIAGKSFTTIDEANLFLVHLDDERQWYRYHHLFTEFLNQRLKEKEPQNVPELHRRASEWFENNGLIVEAVNHSLVGEDYGRAAKLVESIGPDMMMQSEFDQLSEWLDAMPKELVENPGLGFVSSEPGCTRDGHNWMKGNFIYSALKKHSNLKLLLNRWMV